jgi:transposase
MYSKDLRERVIRQRQAGKSVADLVALFAVSAGSIRRWQKRYAETGEVANKARQHWNHRIEPADYEALREQVKQHSDATLEEHVAEWAKTQGVQVSVATMWRALKAIGWSLKKRQWVLSSAMKPSVSAFGRSSRG